MEETPQSIDRKQTNAPGTDPRTLLVRHRNGDRYAFAELVKQYRSQVYSYLVRSGADSASCDDLFQEIFFKVHKAAHLYQAEHPLEPWLFTIVANTVRSFFRKERVAELVSSNGNKGLNAESTTGEDFAQARETIVWLEQALKKLPFSQRETLVLSCVKDLSQKDIAQILDTPVCTVKTNLRRARMSLAKALAHRNLRSKREVSS